MEYKIEENILTVFMPEEVDHHTTEEIRKSADRLVDRYHIHDVIFDFRKTAFMDSSGIGAILGRYRHIHLLGGDVWASNANPRIKKILEMSGAMTIIQFVEEEKKDELQQ